MPNQNILAQIKFKTKAGEGIDLEQERHKLAKMFDQTLRQAKLGQWTGSALKSDALIFYFLVNDEALAGDAITSCFEGYEHRSEFKELKIRQM